MKKPTRCNCSRKKTNQIYIIVLKNEAYTLEYKKFKKDNGKYKEKYLKMQEKHRLWKSKNHILTIQGYTPELNNIIPPLPKKKKKKTQEIIPDTPPTPIKKVRFSEIHTIKYHEIFTDFIYPYITVKKTYPIFETLKKEDEAFLEDLNFVKLDFISLLNAIERFSEGIMKDFEVYETQLATSVIKKKVTHFTPVAVAPIGPLPISTIEKPIPAIELPIGGVKRKKQVTADKDEVKKRKISNAKKSTSAVNPDAKKEKVTKSSASKSKCTPAAVSVKKGYAEIQEKGSTSSTVPKTTSNDETTVKDDPIIARKSGTTGKITTASKDSITTSSKASSNIDKISTAIISAVATDLSIQPNTPNNAHYTGESTAASTSIISKDIPNAITNITPTLALAPSTATSSGSTSSRSLEREEDHRDAKRKRRKVEVSKNTTEGISMEKKTTDQKFEMKLTFEPDGMCIKKKFGKQFIHRLFVIVKRYYQFGY